MTMSEEALRELIGLAGLALTSDDLPGTLVEICRVAVRAVPNADGASVTTFPEGRPGALSDGDWALALDELQYEEHEGPCLDAFRTGRAFRLRDLATDGRWPSYLPRAVERGARSMLSLPMAAQGSLVGALNIYSREVDAFDAEAASVAEVVAAHAGMASEVSAAFFRHRDLAGKLADAMECVHQEDRAGLRHGRPSYGDPAQLHGARARCAGQRPSGARAGRRCADVHP
jgi:GAF domain-containing protein